MRDLDWKSFDVLVVDDEQDNLDAFRFAFRKTFSLHYALGGMQALEELARLDAALIVTDQRMPGMSGLELLRRAKQMRPDALGILLTAYADLPVLVDALNSGTVYRYVQKPWDGSELAVILRQGISVFATMRENKRLRDQLAHYAGYLEREQRDPIDFGELICNSAAMKEVSARIGEVAPTSTHVLVESRVGAEKEIVARAIHIGSPREERPFVKVTCAAFRGEALEREIFGSRRGAFEGATADRAGRVELAHGGTLYLEDPGPPTAALQARLARLLATGEAERVGDAEPRRLDVRLVVSVTPDLDEAWGRDVLPELTSRLSVFPIRLPPLSERREDIRPLAEHFLRKYTRRNTRAARALSNDAFMKLEAYGFPGNVRELENVVERAAILARGDVIQPEHLAFVPPVPAWEKASTSPPSQPVAPAEPESGARRQNLDSQLEEIERREMLAALDRCGGNKAEMARLLGVQRTTLYYRLKRLGIDV
ncbi:sigma-54-dependent transcriptional regulator [Polyangium mundeleinium]|uniref:Sigma-54 dependent transcriptional regulator n=1 Tax=Polyangium mundeleinium TaxID=2995306 RepID=A0ABT5F2H3_9BACT|nr:sigma-54 dependent transcriptional regulator [Polyangium mundeleinium]MDC0747682.1 sigma-54 dependent transcriptional regulator [Polyangium mundeleinium]